MVPQNVDNFVGTMVGHRGCNITSIERTTSCKISICGRGYHHSIMVNYSKLFLYNDNIQYTI